MLPDLSGNNPTLFTRPRRNLVVADDATGPWSYWGGGVGVATAYGTFDSATATLQYSVDDGVTAIDVGDDTTFTAAGGGQFTLPKCVIRAAITSAGSNTAVTVDVAPVH